MKWYHFPSILLLLICFTLTSNISAQIKIGLGAGLISDSSTSLLQGRLEIGPRNFHIASSFNLFLEGAADWAVDIDGHYKVADISKSVYLDVFPGVNLLKNNNDTDIGLNLGGTIRIETGRNAIYIEPKYTVGTYDSFAIAGGFMF